VNVVGDQWGVEEEGEPFTGEEEEEVEECVEGVFWEDERIKTLTLLDRVLVVCFELVECDYMKDCEEDEEGVNNQSEDVAERYECECHDETVSSTVILSFCS